MAEFLRRVFDCLWIAPLRRFVPLVLFRYVLCGGVTVSLDVVWYYMIYHYLLSKESVTLGLFCISAHMMALLIVFPLTFFTGFCLNRYVAFESQHRPASGQLARYALTVMGSLLLNCLLMKLFVDWMGFWATPSKMLTTFVVAAYSFLSGRFFTFRR